MKYDFEKGKASIDALLQQRESVRVELEAMKASDENYGAKEREYKNLTMKLDHVQREYNANEAFLRNAIDSKPAEKSANAMMREYVKAVREHNADSDMLLKRADAQNTILSGFSTADTGKASLNNMESAGIPLTIENLIDPLEMGTIYNQLGLKVATGVRGQIQWPCLDTSAEVSVGGEYDDAEDKTLDFSKITATPVKLGISISVSNEAINDQAFDLVGTITTQMNKAFGRVLNQRVLALTAPTAKADFVGPLVSHKQTATYTKGGATYADLKAIKGKVLATGAQMAGFCYVMDAAMYSTLEATPRDTGSGLFVIQNGTIDGDPVFITDLAAYSGKIVAGCFGYESLNQHGETHFITDIYTQAKKNVTVFTMNADFSLTYLVSSNSTKAAPFVVATEAAN